MKNRTITTLALCTALALVLSYLESLLPAPGVPGVKLGLANLAVLFALYRLGFKEAAAVSLLRVLLVSLLFGHILSFWYSLAGAALSLAGMALAKRCGCFGVTAVSVTGGVLHNAGQLLAARLLLGETVLAYLPWLIASGTVTGAAIGLAGGLLLRRVEKIRRDNSTSG